MNDKETPTMTDQGFIDNIVGPIKDGLDKLRDAITNPPAVIVPGTPVPAPSDTLPAWVKRILGWLLAAALAFIAAKWNITPTPLPSLQSQPQIVVLQVPAGTTVTAASK